MACSVTGDDQRMVAVIGWKRNLGVESSEELGDVSTIVFAHCHSKDDHETCPPILQDS